MPISNNKEIQSSNFFFPTLIKIWNGVHVAYMHYQFKNRDFFSYQSKLLKFSSYHRFKKNSKLDTYADQVFTPFFMRVQAQSAHHFGVFFFFFFYYVLFPHITTEVWCTYLVCIRSKNSTKTQSVHVLRSEFPNR